MKCHRCLQEKSESEFGVVARRYAARERNLWCRECRNAYQRDYRKSWAAQHPEKKAAQKRRALVRSYGLTPEAYEAMHASQNGKCAICRREEAERSLSVDHCHARGHVRGLLCGNCNRMLGLAADDPSLLRRAARYVGIK